MLTLKQTSTFAYNWPQTAWVRCLPSPGHSRAGKRYQTITSLLLDGKSGDVRFRSTFRDSNCATVKRDSVAWDANQEMIHFTRLAGAWQSYIENELKYCCPRLLLFLLRSCFVWPFSLLLFHLLFWTCQVTSAVLLKTSITDRVLCLVLSSSSHSSLQFSLKPNSNWSLSAPLLSSSAELRVTLGIVWRCLIGKQ